MGPVNGAPLCSWSFAPAAKQVKKRGRIPVPVPTHFFTDRQAVQERTSDGQSSLRPAQRLEQMRARAAKLTESMILNTPTVRTRPRQVAVEIIRLLDADDA
jgi:hypothetical protein